MTQDNGSVGHSSAWKKPTARSVGAGGTWKNQLHRWVAHAGQWVLHWKSGALPAASPRIDSLSAYGGEQWQGNIIAKGDSLGTARDSGVFAFYKLGATLGDGFDNFGAATQEGGPTTYVNAIGRRHIVLNGTTNRVRPAADYTMDGLCGGGLATNRLFTLACTFNLDALPPAGEFRFFMSAGNTDARFLGVGVDSAGKIVYARKGSLGETHIVFTAAAAIVPGTYHGVCVLHDDNSSALQSVYLDGVLLGNPSTNVVVRGDGFDVDKIWLGYGPRVTGVAGTMTVAGMAYVAGRFSYWRIAGIREATEAVSLSSAGALQLFLTNSVGVKTDYSAYMIRSSRTEFSFTIPPVAVGNYSLSLHNGTAETNTMPLSCKALPVHDTYLNEEWKNPATAREGWMAAHKQWGGANGGVVSQNVALQDGQLVIEAHGDQYAGTVQGVDRNGATVSRVTRVGAAAVSRKYFGPGSFEFVLRFPRITGAVTTVWLFHYEEFYPTDSLYAAIGAEGIGESGSSEEGFYRVRNHEIDIEIPTAIDGSSSAAEWINARVNTWRGEREGEYTPVNIPHGLLLPDDQFHSYRFDWHLDGVPRVEFYFDGVLKQTITTHIPDIAMRVWIGYWFPSASVPWAGATAPWSRQWMECRRFTYSPFPQAGLRTIGETYPNDYFRSIDLENTLPPIG